MSKLRDKKWKKRVSSNKEQNGITLIALVITIILLLILAGISIMMLTGDNSILKNATGAKEANIIGQEKEYITLAYSSAITNNLGNSVTDQELQDELDKYAGKGNTEVWLDEEEGNMYVHFYDTNHYYNLENGQVYEIDGKNIAPKGFVARIGETYYETLQKAFDDVPADNVEVEVVLLKNVSENVIVKENQNIVLDLNEKTITNIEGTASEGDWNQAPIETYGSLGVKSGKIVALYGNGIENYSGIVAINENVEITGADNGYPVICNYSDGTINISGGKITTESNNTIAIWNKNDGTVSISGGKIATTGENSNVIVNEGGTLEISGTVEISGAGSNYPAIWNGSDGTVSISGGKIWTGSGEAIYNKSGTVNISENAEISGIGYNSTICNDSDGTVNISGGKITGESLNDALRNFGTVSISGGEITAEIYIAIYNDSGTLEISGTAEISGAGYETIYNYLGTIGISGGKITTESSKAIYNESGTLEISGTAEISGAGDYPTIYNYSDGTINISGGKITGECSNALYNDSGTVNISGGELLGKGSVSGAEVIVNEYGTMTISGGNIVASHTSMIKNTGTMEITGTAKLVSTATSSCFGGDIDLTYGSEFVMTGGEIISYSSNSVFYTWLGSTAVFTGGTVKGLGTRN